MLNDDTQVDDLAITSEDVDVDTDANADVDTDTKDWEAEAKKWKAIAERKAKKAEQTKTQVQDTTSLPSREIERLTLKVDGYNDEEVSKIMELGGLKALQNPLVKKAVEVMREERMAENAQVTDGGATSDISRKYSAQDLRKMSASELEKILPQTS